MVGTSIGCKRKERIFVVLVCPVLPVSLPPPFRLPHLASADRAVVLVDDVAAVPMGSLRMDPRPHAPDGFEVVLQDADAPRVRLYAYIAESLDSCNEDTAIAMLVPEVAKKDFGVMAEALKEYFTKFHRIELMEVQPCAIGDAYVRFRSCLERERFLGEELQLGPNYSLRLIKHDEADNARVLDLDREIWVMLMEFPLDGRKTKVIAKAVAGFGILRHWHDTKYRACIVVKVMVNGNAKIPDDVVVSFGSEKKIWCWTCPVYALKKSEHNHGACRRTGGLCCSCQCCADGCT